MNRPLPFSPYSSLTRYEESLTIAREISEKLITAPGLEGLASVVAAQGEPAWAAQLWGRAEALRATIGSPMPPVEQAEYEQAVSIARAQLGTKTFTAAWTEGRTMTLEQVLVARDPATLPEQETTALQPSSDQAKPTYPAGLPHTR